MKFGVREIVFTVLLLLIPVGAWRFVLRPSSQRNSEMLAQIALKQGKLRELNQATGTIGDLKGEIASLEKAVGYFQSKLPGEKEIDKVLNEVSLLAEANHLTTKKIGTLGRTSEKSLLSLSASQSEQPIEMHLEGDFTGFYVFLQALENQPRIMRITQMMLKKLDTGPEGAMKAEMSMSIFFEKDPVQKGPKG
jgi:Tfp pilus assembly protein PilO